MRRAGDHSHAALIAFIALFFLPALTNPAAQAQNDADLWLEACNIADPLTLTEEQTACVAAHTTSILGEDRTFLDLPGVDFPVLSGRSNGCGEHLTRIEPVWPMDEAGNPIELTVPRVVVEVTYDRLTDGSVANPEPTLVEPDAAGFPDASAFEEASARAVSRWHSCSSSEVTHETTRISFQLSEFNR